MMDILAHPNKPLYVRYGQRKAGEEFTCGLKKRRSATQRAVNTNR